MGELNFWSDALTIKPSVGTAYYLGGPDRKGDPLPLQVATNVGLELKAELSDSVKLELNGRAELFYYRDFRQFQLLNPQFPTVTIRDDEQKSVLTQFRVSEAKVSYYGSQAGVFLGYQKAVLGKTEFPLAPANAFSGSDFSSASQIPEYRSMLSLRSDLLLGGGLSLVAIVAPASETRNILPFQISRLKTSLPVDTLEFANQGQEKAIDGLLGLRGSWEKWNLLLSLSREHDHFFKIGGGELDPLNNAATIKGIYPSRETAATEIGGVSGNLVYWLQGNISNYDRARGGRLSSPLGDVPLDYPRYSYQGAAGMKYCFPEQYAYLAVQGFYGSLTGNGELNQAVASASGGIELLNGDLKLGALVNSYWETTRPKLESFVNLIYRPVPNLEISLGGRLAELGVFSLAQPWYGYLGLQFNY